MPRSSRSPVCGWCSRGAAWPGRKSRSVGSSAGRLPTLFNNVHALPRWTEAHTCLGDWVQHLPPEGLREMCNGERFCTFAREPGTRKVAGAAHTSVASVRYAVETDLAGETVTVWFRLYDDQLYVEHGERCYGPYAPSAGPIPLHRYRSFKHTLRQLRVDRLDAFAEQLALPQVALCSEFEPCGWTHNNPEKRQNPPGGYVGTAHTGVTGTAPDADNRDAPEGLEIPACVDRPDDATTHTTPAQPATKKGLWYVPQPLDFLR